MTEQDWLACLDPREMLDALRGGVGGTPSGIPIHRPGLLADVSDRKLRLFACAISRLGADSVPPDQRGEWLSVVADAESYADGLISAEVMERHERWTLGVTGNESYVARHILTDPALVSRQAECAALLREIPGTPFHPAITIRPECLTRQVLALAQAAYEDRCRRCGGVGRADHGTETERCDLCNGSGCSGDGSLDNHRLLVLSDALEEAGCRDEAILRHLRGFGPCSHCVPMRELMRKAQAVVSDAKRAGAQARLSGVVACSECEDGWLEIDHHVRGCWALDLVLGRA